MFEFNMGDGDEENPFAEMLRQQAAKQQVAEMEYNEKERNAHDLFEQLSEAQLIALKDILIGIVHSQNPQAAGNYWRGYAKAQLKSRFNIKPYQESMTEDDFRNLLDGPES